MPNGAFNICCPRDCVSRHNMGTSGAPLKPLRVDSVLRLTEMNYASTKGVFWMICVFFKMMRFLCYFEDIHIC